AYVNGTNEANARVKFSISATEAGIYTFSLRYSNGSATARTSRLNVNDVEAELLSFPSTTSFLQWSNVSFSLSRRKGDNLIELTAENADGLPNLDQIGYYSEATTKGVCNLTSLYTYEREPGWMVFPNPFTGVFTVSIRRD